MHRRAPIAPQVPAPSRGRAPEGAFGMVELLVAMVIIAILFAGALLAFGGAKSSVKSGEAKAAAAAYEEAIARFATDNAGRRPAASDMLPPTNGKARGPRSLISASKPYLEAVPEPVLGGRIGVSVDGTTNCGTAPTTPTGPGAADANAWISYCTAEAAPRYAIRVLTRTNSGAAWASGTICWRGNTTRAPRCA